MSNVQSLERALTLLNIMSDYPDGIQISRLAEQAGLSKSTIHRLLSTLINMKYVTQDKKTEKYLLGYQILYLSRNMTTNSGIISAARPLLEKLCEDINETIHLCIEDNGEVVYIDKIESNQTIRMYSRVGSRNPMYCTGVGKVLLSGMLEKEYEQAVSSIEFVRRTAKTIGSLEELNEEIAIVKKQGYALDNIENEEGIRCIAAPIRDFQGNIVASFSVSGPVHRITMERVNDELVRKVRETSNEISRELGYRM
ncbi:IclR family transcriptional regulator [Domibacillus indicus]|uniref:IclR family transcriptional regulator n=1 Tax=Domibacillus indicus TaxID=1437523 RepID=UPI00061813C7|nr:IclR family transcriptional regulator [Domibacillus indicus]